MNYLVSLILHILYYIPYFSVSINDENTYNLNLFNVEHLSLIRENRKTIPNEIHNDSIKLNIVSSSAASPSHFKISKTVSSMLLLMVLHELTSGRRLPLFLSRILWALPTMCSSSCLITCSIYLAGMVAEES